MKFRHYIALCLSGLLLEKAGWSDASPSPSPTRSTWTSADCIRSLEVLPGKSRPERLRMACEKIQVLDGCQTRGGHPIGHVELKAAREVPHRFLVLGAIHGDEPWSGSLVRFWMERLADVAPRNQWRFLPLVNPEGYQAKTRVNGQGVDLNRNFPTRDWDGNATDYWKTKAKSDKRRFPGPHAGSEPETQCVLNHLKDFKPDFVISVHTPYGLMDFDGPPSIVWKESPLPWKRLGNYPGSLGRYLWVDSKIPILTVELPARTTDVTLARFAKFQEQVVGLLDEYRRVAAVK